jgi:hypothetical protein
MSWRPRPRNWACATEVNRFTVVYDFCVLYPTPRRDLWMRLALPDLYRARGIVPVHEQWIAAVF